MGSAMTSKSTVRHFTSNQNMNALYKGVRAAILSLCLVAFGLRVALNAADNPQVVKTKSGPVNVERLAQLEYPWGMTFMPDGRLLITEKPGRLRIYSGGKLSEPIQGVPKVTYRGQGGLLD